jgi:hypothetical protein
MLHFWGPTGMRCIAPYKIMCMHNIIEQLRSAENSFASICTTGMRVLQNMKLCQQLEHDQACH